MQRGEYRLHGPPGCGKTHALTNVWLPRALSRARPWGRPVLVCSMTQTASTEIASRMGDDPLIHARTLHSHALRQLDGVKVLTPGKLKSWNEAQPQWRMTGGVAANDGTGRTAGFGDKHLAELDLSRHRMKEIPPSLQKFYNAWRTWLDEQGLVDYTGMIEQALEQAKIRQAMGQPPHKGDPGVLIVDEAQDCSRLEQELVRAWGSTAAFFILAGDADQAIYEWRGASPQTFIGHDLPEGSHFHLTRSYRVPRAPHAVAVRWIQRLQERHVVDYAPRDADGLVTHPGASMRHIPSVLAVVHRELEAVGPEGSVMLLAQCAYMLGKVAKGLRERHVPFHNPYRPEESAWNPLAILDRARKFLRGVPAWAHDLDFGPRLWTLQELHRWLQTVSSGCVPAGTKSRVLAAWEAASGEERSKPLELGQLHDLWGSRDGWVSTEAAITDDPLRWLVASTLPGQTASLPQAVKMLGALCPGVDNLTEALIRTPRPRLILGTIHSVKGGEADSVILCPDVSLAARKAPQAEERDALTRLFYVGLTRTRNRLVVLGASEPGAVQL